MTHNTATVHMQEELELTEAWPNRPWSMYHSKMDKSANHIRTNKRQNVEIISKISHLSSHDAC
uniref:Uncharacterized protein n=1 Tax=Setaria italica TaxID=4555 RepID=K3YKP4_SETIT